MFSALFLRNLEGCSEALVNRASQGACPEVIYPRGFRGISPTGGKLEKPRGESAGASTKRGSLKPAYLGHLQVGCSEVLVNRVSPDTLPGDPLFIRVTEVPARKRPIHTGLRAAFLKARQSIAARLCQKTRRRAAGSTSSTARRANAVFWQRKPLFQKGTGELGGNKGLIV